MFGGLGIPELLIILVIILIIFGAGKLPELGGGMGKAIRNFKRGVKDQKEEVAKPEEIEEQPEEDKETAKDA